MIAMLALIMTIVKAIAGCEDVCVGVKMWRSCSWRRGCMLFHDVKACLSIRWPVFWGETLKAFTHPYSLQKGWCKP